MRWLDLEQAWPLRFAYPRSFSVCDVFGERCSRNRQVRTLGYDRTMSTTMDLKSLQDTPPWEWPLDAGKTFLRFLIDPRASESDRLIAADLAGDSVVIDDELAEALLTIVGSSDESEQLRARAVISLGPVLELADTDGFDDPDMLPPITERGFRKIQHSLRKLYLDASTPKEARRRILEASVRAPEEWHQDAIREAYSSGDQEWMLTAVFGMRYIS